MNLALLMSLFLTSEVFIINLFSFINHIVLISKMLFLIGLILTCYSYITR